MTSLPPADTRLTPADRAMLMSWRHDRDDARESPPDLTAVEPRSLELAALPNTEALSEEAPPQTPGEAH